MTNDSTTIILLPGMDGTGLLLKEFSDSAPSEFKPSVVSLPKDEPLDYNQLADKLMSQLPEEKPFLLLGESFSGPLALELSRRMPKGLRGVILVATFVLPPQPQALRWLPWSLIFRLTPPKWVCRRYLCGHEADQTTLKTLRESVRLASPREMSHRVQQVLSVDARESLEECPAPILYLQAKYDRLVTANSLAQILGIRPDIIHKRIEGPHLLLQTSSEVAWREISHFNRHHSD